MKHRTKIVCTLGPAVNSREKIKGLIDAGMNVARLNCSHGDWEVKRQWIEWVRELSSDVSPVAVLADLQGPKFRIGELTEGTMSLVIGQEVTIGPSPAAMIPLKKREILAVLSPGARLLLGDGFVDLKITQSVDQDFIAKVQSAGEIRSHYGVTVVGKVFDVPSLTDKDLIDIQEACDADVDYIALSYVRCAADIRHLRSKVAKHDPSVKLCAKIETRDGLKNLDDILKCVDVVMVARGDLGLQMDIEDVPLAQKKIIEKCEIAGKPVITATQMLESMVHSPRPTRAEASDVANAILDGTDAVMLSGETAAGEYPIECVKTMVRIAEKAEAVYDRRHLHALLEEQTKGEDNHTEAVAFATAQLAQRLKPQAIITTTTSGQTARLVSKFRPRVPILCATWSRRTQNQMSLVWGVESICVPLPETTDENVDHALTELVRRKKLKLGDLVIITAGFPMGTPGSTNLIMTQVVK